LNSAKMIAIEKSLIFLCCYNMLTQVSSFTPVARTHGLFSQLVLHSIPTTSHSLTSPPPTSPERVLVLSDAKEVGKYIRETVIHSAKKAISERGHFALAIPGGSILKMLAGEMTDLSWTDKTTIVYVNHKCVPMDDMEAATHAKARKLFLDSWPGVETIVMDGSADGEAEARSYEEKIRSLSETKLPRCNKTGLPLFDLSLIGVGDDGHVGSLYPGRDEVLVGPSGSWVLPVAKKQPPSITLSLPVMASAHRVIVAACGVSDKYPQGKSEGMRRAVVAEGETLKTFPAVGLRDVAQWVMDRPAASALGPNYN
jgi:6-phosphogluconolactonase